MKATPRLRFSNFTDDWSTKRLSDVLTIGNGRDYKHLGKGGVPVYGTGGYMLSVDDYLYEGESVAIGRKGTIDKPQFLSGKFWTVDTLFYTRDYVDSCPRFIFEIFNNISWQRYNEATGVPSLSKSTIEKIKVNIPSKQEQEKIASFFMVVDERIELASRKVEKLETHKRGLTQKIFTRTLRFKRDDGSDFPDWEEKRLFDTAINMRSGGTPTATNRLYYDNGNIPFLAISDMTEQGKYLEWTSKFINQTGLDNSSSWLVPAGSLVYSMYASVGFVSITKVDMAISQAVMAIILKPKFDIDFIYYSLSNFKNLVHKYIETGTQGNLNAEIVKNIPLGMPCLEEQQKIATFLLQTDEKITLETRKLEELKKFKKSLLQKMFI